ncbi:MAG: two-component regulator propeller domain-containing protein [Candidatus Omnitrophota bacterium]
MLKIGILSGFLVWCTVLLGLGTTEAPDFYRPGGGFTRGKNPAIVQTVDGYIWFYVKSGIARFNGTEIKVFDDDRVIVFKNDFISTLMSDSTGTLWVGTTGEGLVFYKDGAFQALTTKNGLPSNSILSLYEDREQRLWVGSCGSGVFTVKNGCVETVAYATAEFPKTAMSIFEDSEGLLWIGSIGQGLSCYRSQKIVKINEDQGLPADIVYRIIEDETHHLWLFSVGGIIRVSRKEVNDLLNGSARRVDFTVFNKDEGIRNIERHAGNQPAAWKSRDGKLWFPFAKGLSLVDAENVPLDVVSPFVQIKSVIIDGRCYPADKEIAVTWDSGDLIFDYTSIGSINPKQVQFKYKLEGYDREWIEAGNGDKAIYNNVPFGVYTFRVATKNCSDPRNSKEARFHVRLIPSFYRTRLFTLGFLLLIILFGLYFYRIVKKRLSFRILKRKAKPALPWASQNTEGEGHLTKIMNAIEIEKVYRDPELTVNALSQRLKIPSRVISAVINDRLKKNFFELINFYRIKEAQEILKDPLKSEKSMLDIGFDVGFNSKTAFNRAFKHFVNESPSQFKKNNAHSEKPSVRSRVRKQAVK